MARITTSTRKEIPLRVHGLDFLTAGSASCIEETTPSSSPLGSTSDLAEPSWHTHRDVPAFVWRAVRILIFEWTACRNSTGMARRPGFHVPSATFDACMRESTSLQIDS
ncbi:hypothetical protein AURDEDRAFT_178222 [Auricularia subglabra TFB-10046 SS5]|uniref:Uncharacterized protein n=1 Tax=Auricularia subglabra (strain TFB-10046 / SS5) TaxID=717982 RepID=J0WK60_AURST|nr:hypothetical protein AURDEDRAFT_178222 [Auricularia subglabra TFB-10046 SS5]